MIIINASSRCFVCVCVCVCVLASRFCKQTTPSILSNALLPPREVCGSAQKGPGLVVVHVVTVLMTYVKSHCGVRFLSVTQQKSHATVRFHVSPDAPFGQCPVTTPCIVCSAALGTITISVL